MYFLPAWNTDTLRRIYLHFLKVRFSKQNKSIAVQEEQEYCWS